MSTGSAFPASPMHEGVEFGACHCSIYLCQVSSTTRHQQNQGFSWPTNTVLSTTGEVNRSHSVPWHKVDHATYVSKWSYTQGRQIADWTSPNPSKLTQKYPILLHVDGYSNWVGLLYRMLKVWWRMHCGMRTGNAIPPVLGAPPLTLPLQLVVANYSGHQKNPLPLASSPNAQCQGAELPFTLSRAQFLIDYFMQHLKWDI